MMRSLLLLPAVLLAVTVGRAEQSRFQDPQEVLERAVDDLETGRITAAVAGFDTLVQLVPSVEPQLWQRGIALYYAGRYRDCRAQFESHRTVNPNDVENAAWHFLCVARAESAEKARAVLLPVGLDPRLPLRPVYEMLRGALKPEDVLVAPGDDPTGQFYAQLYVGLYFEAIGDARQALKHISEAAADRYAAVGGYMHSVARVHVDVLKRR
jgi:lipoprotein NlpI